MHKRRYFGLTAEPRLTSWGLVGCLLLAMCVAVGPASAGGTSFSSGESQVTLIELYTSEGCSSCPPADQWLTELAGNPGLWKSFVPVAFHVDYWDYLGWKDPFASPEYSERQREYVRLWATERIYTPGFVVNGQEWRDWFEEQTRKVPSPAGKPAGELRLSIVGDLIEVAFQPASLAKGSYQANLVLLGFGVRSMVAAGENQGKELLHDFLVLSRTEVQLVCEEGVCLGAAALPKPSPDSTRFAVAAWIAVPPSPAPIQATGGWLPQPAP